MILRNWGVRFYYCFCSLLDSTGRAKNRERILAYEILVIAAKKKRWSRQNKKARRTWLLVI